MREKILEDINKIVQANYELGKIAPVLSENDLLEDSLMDSFAYAMFWLEISQHYNITKTKKDDEADSKATTKYVDSLDYKTYKVKDLIDRIEKCI